MNFRPKDQIVLLAGLECAEPRARIWAYPELRASLQHLIEAGLVDGADGGAAAASDGDGADRHDMALTDPAGVAAAHALHHIRLDDLIAEHLPERA